MDSFDYAIQMERDGCEFYSLAADTIQDRAAQNMLELLAHDEKLHEEYIEQMKAGTQADVVTNVARGIKNVFEKLIETDSQFIDEDGSFTDVLRRGVEIERMSVKLYEGFAQKSQNPAEKEFWKKLLTVEEKHEKLLKITLEYIDKPNVILESGEFLFYDYDDSP